MYSEVHVNQLNNCKYVPVHKGIKMEPALIRFVIKLHDLGYFLKPEDYLKNLNVLC
jgi:hypothetical protein